MLNFQNHLNAFLSVKKMTSNPTEIIKLSNNLDLRKLKIIYYKNKKIKIF